MTTTRFDMNAREQILQRLQSQVREVTPPETWRSRRQFDDLAGRFIQTLTASKGEVHQAKNFAAATEQIAWLLHENKIGSVLVDNVPPLSEIDVQHRWPQVKWHVVGESDNDRVLRDFAATTDLGISVAEAALAETGTVVISTGPGRSRLTGLLPPVHLVLVSTSVLAIDLFTWTAARKGSWPASLTLIGGPSKTADIEQTMATGVHGPGRFIALLYED